MKKSNYLRILFCSGLGASMFLTAVPLLEAQAADEMPNVEALALAAQKGEAEALFELARAYFRGRGVEQDEARAIELLNRAAGAGHAEAMSTLGFFHLNGTVVEKDSVKAADWFQRGAEAGSVTAQHNYGLLLRRGEGTTKSNEKGLEWLEKAAGNGSVDASTALGQLFFLGDADVRADATKAFPHLLISAESGDLASQNMLGLCYQRASGTQRDLDAAEKWFRAAAGKNDAKAQANLAKLLGVDSPTSPRREEALKWLLVAVNQAEITARKTFDELMPSFPADMLAAARKEADAFATDQLRRTNAQRNASSIKE